MFTKLSNGVLFQAKIMSLKEACLNKAILCKPKLLSTIQAFFQLPLVQSILIEVKKTVKKHGIQVKKL